MEKKSTHEGLSEMAMEIVSRKKPPVAKNGKTASKNGHLHHKNGDGQTAVDSAVSKNGNGQIKSGKSSSTRDLEAIDSAHLLSVLMEVKNGNFNVRMPIDRAGLNGKICDTLNEIILTNKKLTQEFTKAQNSIGKEGKLNQRIILPGAQGDWNTGVEALNAL